MQKIDSLPDLSDIGKLLKGITSIAIVGLSPKEDRPSNMVARYLMDVGYTIYPVNPGQKEILGEICYPDLLSIPHKVDVVNVFRRRPAYCRRRCCNRSSGCLDAAGYQ